MIDTVISNGVETIGAKDIIIKCIFTVSWTWTDDKGQLHTNKGNNVLYFLEYPLDILSATTLSESINENEVTWVLTKIKYYFFTWDLGKYKNKIAH